MDLDACFGCGAATFNRIDGKWCESCNRIATTHLPLVPLTDEEVQSLTLDAAVIRLAAELIDLHIATGIDLNFWPVARRFVALAGRERDDSTTSDYADAPISNVSITWRGNETQGFDLAPDVDMMQVWMLIGDAMAGDHVTRIDFEYDDATGHSDPMGGGDFT